VFDIVHSGVNWNLVGKCYLYFRAVYRSETSVTAPNTAGCPKLEGHSMGGILYIEANGQCPYMCHVMRVEQRETLPYLRPLRPRGVVLVSTLSLTSGLNWGMGGQGHAPAALPPGKEKLYPLCRRLGGPQSRSGRVRKISPPSGYDPRTVQPVTSLYTDCAILSPVLGYSVS